MRCLATGGSSVRVARYGRQAAARSRMEAPRARYGLVAAGKQQFNWSQTGGARLVGGA